MIKKFILIGVAGYIAKKHVESIYDNNSKLIAAYDPSSNVGFLDSFSRDIHYFNNFLKFDIFIRNYLKKNKLHFLTICSPNNTHVKYIKYGLNLGLKIICEKPICITNKELKYLSTLNSYDSKKIYPILQLRYSTITKKILKILKMMSPLDNNEAHLLYVTPRGNWYNQTWKGDVSKSGGLLLNIGVHLFDFLIFLMGNCEIIKTNKITNNKASGQLFFGRYNLFLNWKLSLDFRDLPNINLKSYRELYIAGKKIEFSDKFNDLHSINYQKILKENAFSLVDNLYSIKTILKIKNDT